MKSVILRRAIVVLPLLALSSPGFACQEAPAAKEEKALHESVHKMNHQHSEQRGEMGRCDHAATPAAPDDDALPASPSVSQTKGKYNEE